ncbi:MAG: sigma-70 family RNA polymerase sigma factor [Clostridiales bacterium]|nr:sigma-70 family RNA polymerase sigma factor [Clostridiales bacterium]
MSEKELEKLYNEAYKAVYWTAFSILKNNEDAEDVVQETFVTAFEQYDSLKDKSKAVSWVKKIAANKSLNIVTRKRTVNVGDEVLDETEDIGEDFLPDSLVESAETRKVIMDIIHNTLSEDTAMTIILFYFDEMSIKEIAELLHIPQGTVLSRLNYAKKKIKKEVEKYEKDNKDKLFAMGIPFLTKLFEKEAEQVPFRPMPASLLSLTTASSKATAAAAATAAATASAAIVVRNIIIGIVTAGAVGGAGYFGYRALVSRKEKAPETSPAVVASDVSETTDGSAFVPGSSDKIINVRGMTPDQLDLSGGYVRTSTYHDAKDGTSKPDHQLYYDADGHLVLDCLYNDDNVVIDSKYYIYDKDGRLVREELWDVSVNDYGLYKEYSYGAHGIERVDKGTFERDPDHYYLYEYDPQGRLIKETEYTTKQGLTYWFCDYEYEADGTYITRVTSWDTLKQEMRQSKDYCKYSSDGKLLEEYDGSWKRNDVYTYDSEGKLTLLEKYDGKKLMRSTTYEYDAEDRLISEKTTDKNGEAVSDYTYEYKNL